MIHWEVDLLMRSDRCTVLNPTRPTHSPLHPRIFRLRLDQYMCISCCCWGIGKYGHITGTLIHHERLGTHRIRSSSLSETISSSLRFFLLSKKVPRFDGTLESFPLDFVGEFNRTDDTFWRTCLCLLDGVDITERNGRLYQS